MSEAPRQARGRELRTRTRGEGSGDARGTPSSGETSATFSPRGRRFLRPHPTGEKATVVDNQEKQRIWQAYHARKPIRVPATLGANARVILLDEKLNPAGIQFERYYHDPAVTVKMQLKHMEYKTEYLARYCDYPSAGRKKWSSTLTTRTSTMRRTSAVPSSSARARCPPPGRSSQGRTRTISLLSTWIIRGRIRSFRSASPA